MARIARLSRNELAEELNYRRQQSLTEYRNDDSARFNREYFEFWNEFRTLEERAKQIGLTEEELEEARRRVERRENLYRQLYVNRRR